MSTTERSPNSASRSSPLTDSGATLSTDPRRASCDTHVTSYGEWAATRSAVSCTASTIATATLRAPSSACLARPISEMTSRAASRTRAIDGGQLLGQLDDPALRQRGQRLLERRRGVGEVLRPVHDPPGPGRGPLHHRRRQLVGRDPGDPVDQLVRLVDDHRVVLGQHREALQRVDRQQRVVGHHDLDLGRPVAGQLGEALLAERALRRAQALARGDADLPPGPVVDAGVELVAVAGLGLLGPAAQPHHVPAQRRRGRRVEQRVAVVVGHPAEHLVAAQVVGPALEDRVRRSPAQQRLDRVDQGRQVTVDHLVLQRDRRGGDDHGVAVQQRRHQVGQRLAGAGAGLDEQVAAVGHGGGHRLGHLRPGRVARCRPPRRPRRPAARARSGPRRPPRAASDRVAVTDRG